MVSKVRAESNKFMLNPADSAFSQSLSGVAGKFQNIYLDDTDGIDDISPHLFMVYNLF